MKAILLLVIILTLTGYAYTQDVLNHQQDSDTFQFSTGKGINRSIPEFDSIISGFSKRDQSNTLARKYYDSLLADSFNEGYNRMKTDPSDNTSYYYFNSRMPVLTPGIYSKMPVRKPNPNVRYHILERRIILYPPVINHNQPNQDNPAILPRIHE